MKQFLLLLSLLCGFHGATAATFLVTNTADSGAGSLRQAIINANAASGADAVNFNIPASDPNCDATTHVCTIQLASALPTITEALVVDGYTQPGTSANTQTLGTNAVLLIRLTSTATGTTEGSYNAFGVATANCVIRGLTLTHFYSAISLAGGSTTNNSVEGCFIGLQPDGVTADGNTFGVAIANGANNNTIGGTALAARNLISGQFRDFSVSIHDAGSDNNKILNNLIGLTRTGTSYVGAVPRFMVTSSQLLTYNVGGVVIYGGAKNNHIGSTAAGAGNVISGNGAQIEIFDAGSTGNVIEGNRIGTNAAGTEGLNLGVGIEVYNTSGTIIGGPTSASRNIISGNAPGVFFSATNNNVVQSNYIGTDVTGTARIGNSSEGLEIDSGSGNVIGGVGAGNIISGNSQAGIEIFADQAPAATGNVIMGNGIGIGSDGRVLANDGQGILISYSNALNNAIGGTGAGQGNIIANNGAGGVVLSSSAPAGNVTPSSGNAILGNSIYDNTGRGISVNDTNDDCDLDGGPNNGQNFPILFSATGSGTSTRILGTLNSTSNSTFTIEFFVSPACDDSGFGEGKTFIGRTMVTTDGSCNAAIDFTAAAGNLVGQSISATATDLANNTSGFSPCAGVGTGAASIQLSGSSYSVGEGAGTVTITATRTGDLQGSASIRYGTSNGTALAGSDYSAVSGYLTFGASETTKTFTIPILEDSAIEGDETFFVTLSSPSGAMLGSPASATITIIDNDTAPTPMPTPARVQLSNISGRAFGQPNDQASISGFIIREGTGKHILARGIGPSLRNGNTPVPGAMQDPRIELHDGSGALIYANDNWRDSQEAEIQATGLAPSDDREAAIAAVLPPGAYTAILRGANNSGGIALVEIYELQLFDGKLANVSVRGNVLTDDNVLINGLILQGGAPTQFLFRAIGPELHDRGLTGELQDPKLDVYNQNGVLLGSNDNWRDSPDAAAIQASGLAPTDDRESAVLLTLPAASYTAIVSGVNRTMGIALAETYQLN